MAPAKVPLSTVIPRLICGTATFNNQYNTDPSLLPTNTIVARALDQGVRAFDTSPYYGPAETLLGTALAVPSVTRSHPRSSYFILTKVGRIGGSEFDYSPEWIRHSINRSCERLRTEYLDVVYCHDVEFVSRAEVLEAVKELRRIRDKEGTIKYIGISGYPVPLLCELAEAILHETHEPLDVVQSYANFTIQNTLLLTEGLSRLKKAGVSVVPNASLLGMGLLRSQGVPIGGKGDFHPAPAGLRSAVIDAARWVEGKGERLEVIALRWALESWTSASAILGNGQTGISVMGVSNVAELAETMRVWNSVLDGVDIPERHPSTQEQEWSAERKRFVDELVTEVQRLLGKWNNYTWPSPGEGFVNIRAVNGTSDHGDSASQTQQ